MRAFGPRGVSSKAVSLSQSIETFAPSSDDLVHVRLMARVEDDRILRTIEDSMDSECQFDDTEVRTKVTSTARDLLDQEFADLTR
jgi:hypothetical protein